ncbi:unnamed protein product, partial [Polarella glacialis]
MDWWTIFYWGWWISWAPLWAPSWPVSPGVAPSAMCFFTVCRCHSSILWFGTFGGAAIRMHRRATLLSDTGFQLHQDANLYLHTSSDFRPAGAGKCYSVPDREYVTDIKVSQVCAFSWKDDSGYWFDLIGQYHGMGPFLVVVSIIDIESLKALQSIFVFAGLPFAVVIMLMCTALWRALKIDQKHMPARKQRVDWALPLHGGIFDILEFGLSLGTSGLPQSKTALGFFLGLFAPPRLLWKSLRSLAALLTAQPSSALQ